MTGHLVLASIHANDAWRCCPRLLDMGVEPYQLAAAFRGAVAQRLVAPSARTCRAGRPRPSEAELGFIADHGLARADARVPGRRAARPAKGRVFKGALSIAEAFLADEALLRAIAERRPAARDRAAGSARLGLASMAADGLDKADARRDHAGGSDGRGPWPTLKAFAYVALEADGKRVRGQVTALANRPRSSACAGVRACRR